MGWVGPEGRAASGSLPLAPPVCEGPSRASAPWAVCDRLLVLRGHWFPGAAGCSWPVHPSEGSPAAWGRNPSEPLVDPQSVLWTRGVAQGHTGVMLVQS